MDNYSQNTGLTITREHELIEECKMGKQESFKLLLNNNRNIIENCAFKILFNKEAVKDVMQEVFLKIFKNIDKFNYSCKFSTWVHKITLNESFRYKFKDNLAVFDEFDIIDKIPHGEDTIPDNVLLKERELLLSNLISELEPNFKAVIVLYYKSNLSLKEISEILNISIGTVSSRISRARDVLKENLNKSINKTWEIY